MIVLAFLGWIVLIGVGGCFLVAAYASLMANLVFPGEHSWLPVLFAVSGLILIGLAIWQTPFHIIWTPRP